MQAVLILVIRWHLQTQTEFTADSSVWAAGTTGGCKKLMECYGVILAMMAVARTAPVISSELVASRMRRASA